MGDEDKVEELEYADLLRAMGIVQVTLDVENKTYEIIPEEENDR